MSIFKNKSEVKPSMRRRLVFSLGSLAAILLLSGIISIIEYRRMSDYVSELIASNIKSIIHTSPKRFKKGGKVR